jgi:hypothetical protein
LAGHLQEQVLFVCGDAHRWTFRNRLEERGVEVKVIAKRFGAAPLPVSINMSNCGQGF